MTTKAELFRWLSERAAWKPAAEQSRKEPRAGRRGASTRAGKKASYALESTGGRRTRKSTRRSANRQKTDVQFRMKRRVSEARTQDRARVPR